LRRFNLVERVVDVAASFADVFLQASAICAEIDVLASFAEVAVVGPRADTLNPKPNTLNPKS
jgi:hypothetical protein